MATLYSEVEEVVIAIKRILGERKSVQLVVGPLRSKSKMHFTVHRESDIPEQVEHAFAEARAKRLCGVGVKELKLSSER